jgi:hypothetical protein
MKILGMVKRLLRVILAPLFLVVIIEAILFYIVGWFVLTIRYIITGEFGSETKLDKYAEKMPVITLVRKIYDLDKKV